jgi:hypothetical protein
MSTFILLVVLGLSILVAHKFIVYFVAILGPKRKASKRKAGIRPARTAAARPARTIIVHTSTPAHTVASYAPAGIAPRRAPMDPAAAAALGRGARMAYDGSATRPMGWPSGTETWRA